MAEVAVYAVVYPAAMRYFGALWRDLAPQLTSAFEVCLSLDGVAEEEVLAVTGRATAPRFIETPPAPGTGHPSATDIRRHALMTLADEYSSVVLLDSDDVPLPGRLDSAREALREYDVHACAMRIVDVNAEGMAVPDFTLSTAALHDLEHGALLATVNAVGFGNSAYRSDVLRSCVDVPPDTVLMDWLVASRAYLDGATFEFDTTPRMLYRQYDRNTASVLAPFSAERVLTDARRVADHYRLLLSTPHGTRRSATPFERARERAQSLLTWLESPVEGEGKNLTHYVERLNALPTKTFLWWQHVTDSLPGPESDAAIFTKGEEGTA